MRVYISTRQPIIWVLALCIGLTVSAAAIVFRELIAYIQIIWLLDSSENVASAARSIPWYLVLLGPAAGGAIVGWCLVNLLPTSRTGGVADVIEARALGGRNIELRPAIYSAFTTITSLGFGASAGREGPVVHLGAAVASSIAQRFRLAEWSRKTLLGCGVAAAVSASFNAPIAGVLFAHEVILGHYAMRAFVPIVISSVSGTILSRLWFGGEAAFVIPDYQITSFWEFPAFALLGIVCALVSVLFQFALVSTDYVARNIQIPLFYRPVIGGLIIGFIAIFLPEILGVGYEATNLALTNQLSIGLLFALLIGKTAATAITLASRFGGGIFSPALYLGAMAGGAFGLIAAQIFPELASSQGLYSILGMGAVAAAVLGAPISTAIIIFELTGGYALTIALLLTVSISTGINQAIHGHSYFHWQLEMRGLFVQDGPHRHMMRSTKVMDFMETLDESTDAEVVPPNLADHALDPTDNLEAALRAFDYSGQQRLPVADAKEPENLIGWASQVHALRYFNKALVDASEEEHLH